MTLIPDLLIFYVAFRVSQKKSGAKTSLNKYLGGVLSFAVSFLFLFTVLGAIINLMPALSYLWGLRMLLRYVLLVWVIYRCFEMKDVKKYKRYMYLAFDINVVVCILEFVAGIRGDWMSGTFSGNGVLMLHALLVMMMSTADFFQGKMRPTRYGIYIACMFMIAILAEIKMMYFLFPLTFYGGYVMNKKFSLMHIVVLVLALIGMNVFLVLTIGIFLAGIIGIAMGGLSVFTFAQNVWAGFTGMNEVFFLTLFCAGMSEMVAKMGGIDWLIQ
jgi:hypothetical protein